ncbi:MAG: hypothetical protein J7L26_00705 [Candidatus Aminicenantes bacterium]|nr:hypothetical protein [Candidatus Aminicenantes bacterium]
MGQRVDFKWNPLADQPHNVASRRERLRRHWQNIGHYLALFPPNLKCSGPIIKRYFTYRSRLYRQSLKMEGLWGVAVSPLVNPLEETVTALKELGVRRTLVRIPSWEREKLPQYQNYIRGLKQAGLEVMVALLQNRFDVVEPARWRTFILEIREALPGLCREVEIGHAWNRTKWGVWTHVEYLELARPAFAWLKERGFRPVGPAVIDFEFHLYPPVLQEIDFNPVTSLLYVDRVGAPENRQFGWNTSAKVALLKAMIDAATGKTRELWITEVNWPLAGTGPYSPAAGKPNVSEEDQASFLVRYFLLVGSSGLVSRVYWWQLVAPGYGLIDSRGGHWRKRPAFYALQTMIRCLEGSLFLGRVLRGDNYCFLFETENGKLAVCWRKKGQKKIHFPFHLRQGFTCCGDKLVVNSSEMILGESPVFVYFED